MTITDNRTFAGKIEEHLTAKLPIRLGINKKNELVRLIYEICRAGDLTLGEFITQVDIDKFAEEGRGELFHRLKKTLLKMRYPSIGLDDNPHIMPVKIAPGQKECPVWYFELAPKNIFVEKSVQDLEWTNGFIRNFPGADVVVVEDVKEVRGTGGRTDPVEIYNSRRENIFLVKNRSAFIKMCPCTKGCRRCGYWILNVGFGCPIDCAYCYLQMYSNVPGFILPANIEDYYEHILRFDRKVGRRTRIGTGEFTDSLALDKYTGYSSRLIPFFRDTRNLVLELKTKIGHNEIDNVIREKPHENVVISWSLNTPHVADKYEEGSVSVPERIDAAVLASLKGYKVGFHFDPIVCYKGWEDDYKAVVEEIFSIDRIRNNIAWISLGTLRYTPGLKQTAEQRFADNRIFYEGEFFADSDGKLRYPRELRIDMYNKMVRWIREHNKKCWIYLCMEPEEVWRQTVLGKRDYSYR